MPEEFIEDIIKESGDEAKSAEEVKAAIDSGSNDEEVKPEEKPQEDVVASDKDAAKAEVVAKAEKNPPKTAEQVEELATQLGWNPDHQGPDKVDAATYILRSREIQDTMRGYNKDLKGQVSALQESINALKEHNEKVYKAEVRQFQAELNRLKKEKKAAVELADVDKVDELDEQIDSLQKDLQASEEKNVTTQPVVENPVYDEWIKDNEWYEQDDEMAMFADKVAGQYEGAPLERVYSLVRRKVEEVFPERFENKAAATPAKETTKPVGPTSPVEKSTKREGGSSFTADDLTPDQRSIMRQFVQTGVMTEKQYLEDIAKLQEG